MDLLDKWAWDWTLCAEVLAAVSDVTKKITSISVQPLGALFLVVYVGALRAARIHPEPMFESFP